MTIRRIHEFFEDDTDTVTVTIPGAPDISTATATFHCTNADGTPSPTDIVCTGLTATGELTIPLAGLLDDDPSGQTYTDARVVIVDGADQTTYRIRFNGYDYFKVSAAI